MPTNDESANRLVSGRLASRRRCHASQLVDTIPSNVLTTTAFSTGTARVMMGIASRANPKPAMTCVNAATKMATATTTSCTVVTTVESATYAGGR